MDKVMLFTSNPLRIFILTDENMIIPVHRATDNFLTNKDKLESNIMGITTIEARNDRSNIKDLVMGIFFSISYMKQPRLKYIE